MTERSVLYDLVIIPVVVIILLSVLLVVLLVTAGCTGQSGIDNKESDLTQQNAVNTLAQPTVIQPSDLFTSSVASGRQSPQFPKEKYVFFEHHIHMTGIPINGTCSPGLNIDFPTYSFEPDSAKLKIFSLSGLKNVNNSLIMIYGHGKSLDGLAGSGAGTIVFPVYSIPIAFSEGGNVTFDSIMADGTVSFRYDNRQLSLEPNETWENITRTIEKSGPPDYRFNCTAEFITTDRFYNAGILDKTNISTG